MSDAPLLIVVLGALAMAAAGLALILGENPLGAPMGHILDPPGQH